MGRINLWAVIYGCQRCSCRASSSRAAATVHPTCTVRRWPENLQLRHAPSTETKAGTGSRCPETVYELAPALAHGLSVLCPTFFKTTIVTQPAPPKGTMRSPPPAARQMMARTIQADSVGGGSRSTPPIATSLRVTAPRR